MTAVDRMHDGSTHDGRWDGLLFGASLATLDAARGYGEIEDGALAWKDGVLRFVGPVRVLAIVFLGMGVFYLNRTDPKRLTAVLIVVGLGLAWLAYRTASQRL